MMDRNGSNFQSTEFWCDNKFLQVVNSQSFISLHLRSCDLSLFVRHYADRCRFQSVALGHHCFLYNIAENIHSLPLSNYWYHMTHNDSTWFQPCICFSCTNATETGCSMFRWCNRLQWFDRIFGCFHARLPRTHRAGSQAWMENCWK